MYNNVVVPLDGSKLAELALPHLEVIGKGCSIPKIMLVSVTEKIKGQVAETEAYDKYTPENRKAAPLPPFEQTQLSVVFDSDVRGKQEIPLTLGKMAKTAADYLCEVAKDLEEKGFRVTAAVLRGNPADEITRYVEENSADLVIMAGTGKSSVSQWNMSTIANKVIKGSSAPVLLIKPGPSFKETKPKRKGVAL